MSRPTVPHHGPVTAGCPLECLSTVLGLMAWNRLKWACDLTPDTVGDVVKLLVAGELSGVNGLGPKRTVEIEAALISLGLYTTGRAQLAQTGTA